jgi:glycosyltransferase involved in cell wall biosynthesis
MAHVDLEKKRGERLRQYAIQQAQDRFDADYPGFQPEEILVSVCAYEEEDNIGDVLAKMPESIDGKPYTVFVVVDGGDDRTAEVARRYPGIKVFEFPVNLGHGVALQVTYRYCMKNNVKYCLTLDADGQNDPAELPNVLRPLANDTADFVLTSRVLGEDKTSDAFRKSGVRFFSIVINRMCGTKITDTSTGYRGLRVSMLAKAVDHLIQDQYQTSELFITCMKLGYRPTEVPTVWYPRASGTTKKGKNWLYAFRYARVVFGTYFRARKLAKAA